jgi:hypothetical protein
VRLVASCEGLEQARDPPRGKRAELHVADSRQDSAEPHAICFDGRALVPQEFFFCFEGRFDEIPESQLALTAPPDLSS